MWTDRTSEECINKIKIPLKISAHLRGALKLLNNKSEIFRFFNPANKSEKPLELPRKDSLNRNSHRAMNHMWHVWFYFMAIRRLLQLVFQSLRSFSTGPALMVVRTGSGWQRWRRRLWSRDGGDGGKHDSYRGGEGGGGPRTLQVPGELLPGTLGLMTLMGLSLSKGAPRKRRAGTRGGGGGRVRGYKKEATDTDSPQSRGKVNGARTANWTPISHQSLLHFCCFCPQETCCTKMSRTSTPSAGETGVY